MTSPERLLAPLRLGVLVSTDGPLRPWDQRLINLIRRDHRFDVAAVIVSRKAYFSRQSSAELAGIGRLALEDADAIKALGLDTIIQLGTTQLTASILDAARFGVWGLEHGGLLLGRTDDAGYRDSFRRRPVIAVDLMARGGEAGDGHLAGHANFNRDPYVADQQSAACEKAVGLFVKALKKLALKRELPVAQGSKTDIKPIIDGPLAVVQHQTTAALNAASKISKRLQTAVGRKPLRWSLFVGKGEATVSAFKSARELKPGKGEFWADPFLMQRRGKTYVFFENYDYASKRGKISAGVFNGVKFDVMGDALKLDCHLSFPFIFEHGGDVFMMPEMSERRRLEIYRAVNFPLTWTLHSTALHGRSIADPVVFEDHGRWWLFANVSETPFEDHCNELHLFSIDGPALKSVVPHPLNPVVIGADRARNGGRVVRENGKLLRYAQINTDGIYGRGLQTMEIIRLDADAYEERPFERFETAVKPGLIGMHHFDRAGDLFVFDGCRRFG